MHPTAKALAVNFVPFGPVLAPVHVRSGELVVICISAVKDFKSRCPELYDAIIECSSFVNYRRIETGAPAVLAVSFYL